MQAVNEMRYQYIPFWDVAMDEYSRVVAVRTTFSIGGGWQGTSHLLHNMSMIWDLNLVYTLCVEYREIQCMRTLSILHSTHTANEIAQPNNICELNPDMYGIDPAAEGAQEYYDSLLALYAQWGVDFIKCDDICRMDMPTAKEEIRMLSEAIEKCGRPIVLSLSPGPAKIEEALVLRNAYKMWRITDDFLG